MCIVVLSVFFLLNFLLFLFTQLETLNLRILATKLNCSKSDQRTANDSELLELLKKQNLLKKKQYEDDDKSTKETHYKQFLSCADVVCTTLGKCLSMMK